MRKMVLASLLAATIGVAGSVAWKSDASAGHVVLPSVLPHSSPVQPAACGGRYGEHCPPGYTWRCGPYGQRCWCGPC